MTLISTLTFASGIITGVVVLIIFLPCQSCAKREIPEADPSDVDDCQKEEDSSTDTPSEYSRADWWMDYYRLSAMAEASKKEMAEREARETYNKGVTDGLLKAYAMARRHHDARAYESELIHTAWEYMRGENEHE